MTTPKEFDHSPCPDARNKPYYPIIICNLNDKPCLREQDLDCPYYQEYLAELKEDADGISPAK